MSENILEKIITKKTTRVDKLKRSITIESLKEKIDENKTFNSDNSLPYIGCSCSLCGWLPRGGGCLS